MIELPGEQKQAYKLPSKEEFPINYNPIAPQPYIPGTTQNPTGPQPQMTPGAQPYTIN